MIYFIQETEFPNRIKVGYSKDAAKRIAVLGSILPQKIKILRVTEGDRGDEQAIHLGLKPFRVEGTKEWYQPFPEVLEFIESGDFNAILKTA